MTRAPTIPNYEWVITEDLITDHKDTPPCNLNAVGLVGPHNALSSALHIAKFGEMFRLLDDDGNIYYYGAIILNNDDGDGEEDFAPLYDFGMPNAGCVTIEYLVNGEWEPL